MDQGEVKLVKVIIVNTNASQLPILIITASKLQMVTSPLASATCWLICSECIDRADVNSSQSDYCECQCLTTINILIFTASKLQVILTRILANATCWLICNVCIDRVQEKNRHNDYFKCNASKLVIIYYLLSS